MEGPSRPAAPDPQALIGREERGTSGCRLEGRWGIIEECNFIEFDYTAGGESTHLVFCRPGFF